MTVRGFKKNCKSERVSGLEQLMKLSGLWRCSLVFSFSLECGKCVEFGPEN